MAPDPDNVVVAGTGAVYVAPEGTALPAALAALAAPWKELGYVGEDGVTFTSSRDQDELRAWQSSDPVRVLVTAEPKTIEFELLEFGSPDVVELALRGGTIAVAASVATFTPPAAGVEDVRAMVIEAEDDGASFRFCFARVALSDDVAMQLAKSDATRLPLTFGVQSGGWKIVTDHPAWVAAGASGLTAADLVASIGENTTDDTLRELSKHRASSVKAAAKDELQRRRAGA